MEHLRTLADISETIDHILDITGIVEFGMGFMVVIFILAWVFLVIDTVETIRKNISRK